MALSEPTTETFLDKASTFAAFANESIETSFNYDQKAARLQPLTLTYLNQEYIAFSDALVAYEKQTACFRMESWYSFYFQKLLKVMAGKNDIEDRDRPPFQRLFGFLQGNNLPCIRRLLQQEDLNERKVAATMAIHYFKPLIPNGTYIIDKSYPDATAHAQCELCEEKVNYGDTSLGNSKTLHGKVDVILNRNIVKVTLEDELSQLQLNEDENEEPDSDCQEFAIKEVKLLSNVRIHNAQFISEGIVNAFYVSKQESNRYQFIPSYFVTEKYIKILFYNVELDILLKSTKLPIWLNEKEGSLNVMTLIRVWLTLNYSAKLDKLQDRYDFFVKNIEKAGFKTIVGDAYSEYLNQIDRPLKLSRPQKRKPIKTNLVFSKYDAEEYEMIMDSVLDFTTGIKK